MEHVDPWMGIIFPYANFAIFIAAAIYFFKKPLKTAANKKREDFEKLAAEAQAARAAAEAKLAELQLRQSALVKEISDMLAVSKQTSEAEAVKIVADAEHIAANLREEAKRVAAAEVEKARHLLRSEVVHAVHNSVVARIRNDVTSDQQRSLVHRRIDELKTLHTES